MSLLRYITILSSEADPLRSVAGKPEDGVDLRTLRAIRVLRPLKLVSGVPSKWFVITLTLSFTLGQNHFLSRAQIFIPVVWFHEFLKMNVRLKTKNSP